MREAAQPIYEEWITDMKSKDIDGAALISEAQELIQKYSK